MPDSTPYNISEDTAASIRAARHPARASLAEDTAVTNALVTHDFYATPGNIIDVFNTHATAIRHAPMTYETGTIGSTTFVTREKYYPFTTSDKAILDAHVARGALIYATIPPVPA